MRRILLFIFLLAISTNSVKAAEFTVDSTVHATVTSHNGSSPTAVFISDQIGYSFYRDSTGICVYSKTINGGTVWGAAVTVDAQIDCAKIAVWYDRWTPGDTTGNFIHITTIDTGSSDVWYTRLDTNSDTLTATVNATGANQGGGFALAANLPSVTKGTNGDLYMGIQDVSDSFVIMCLAVSDCVQATNWVEAGTNPFDLATDWLILMPLSGGNIMAIRWDISADDIQSKVYNNTANLWDVAWTTIDLNAVPNITYDASFGATLDKGTGDIYLAYAVDASTLGTDDDIRTAKYSGGIWTSKSDVLTNDIKGITGAKIALDENSKDIYVVYSARTTPGTASTGNIYFKKSDLAMVSWGVEQGPINTTAGDIYGARVNAMSNERIYATWDLPSADDLLGETIADLVIPALTIGSAGTQTAVMAIPSSNNFIGGAFTINRTSGTATVMVSQIIFLETGTVNANLNLSNLKVYFETADACSFEGNETLFGTAASFSAGEKATANGTMTIDGSQICVYLVLDIGAGASNNQTLEKEISNPSAEIAVSVGTVSPVTSVVIAGTTNLISNQPPVTPTNVSPANGVTINNTLTPALSASAFSDIDLDLFAASQWQITTIPGNYTSPIWNSGQSGPAATTVTVGTALSNNTTYYWHVRYKDSAGLFSNYSAETSFIIANVAPNTPLNAVPSASSTVTTFTPLFEGSAYSDTESNVHAGTQWQIALNSNFLSPVFDFIASIGETSRTVSPNTLTNFNSYYWRVRYRDNFVSDHWSNYSSPTGFIVAISSIAVQVKPIAGKTEFFAGDTVPIDVEVINFSTGSPINDATTTISIYNPSGTKIVNQQVMNYISGSNGIYRFSFTAPSTNGVYLYEVKSEKGEQNGFGAGNFQIGAVASIASDVSVVKTAQQKAFNITMSDVSELQSGKTYRLKVLVEDFESNAVDAFIAPNVTLYDGVRNIVVASSSMTKLSTGTYEFTYLTSSGQIQGLWEASVFVPLTSTKTVNRSDFFQLLGSPAQVKINSISDNTVPNISANVTITNEGLAPFEYHYEYCVVVEQNNSCGGNDDIAYALAAKLINPGQDFITDLALNISNPGDYYFKIVVYWGTERSGASRQFTAVSAPVAASVLATVGGGGGGGGGGITQPQPVSFLDFIWQKVMDLFNLFFRIDERISVAEKRIANVESLIKTFSVSAPKPVAAPASRQKAMEKIVEKFKEPAKIKFRIRFE